jgi:archaellum component FlaC
MVALSLEERVARIEGILEQMDKRLNHIESDIVAIRTEIAGLRREIIELRSEMHKRFDSFFKWLVSLILGMWVTIIVTLIPILLKILGVI